MTRPIAGARVPQSSINGECELAVALIDDAREPIGAGGRLLTRAGGAYGCDSVRTL